MVWYKNRLREAKENTDYVCHLYFEESAERERIEEDLKSSRQKLEETRKQVEFLEKEVHKLREGLYNEKKAI